MKNFITKNISIILVIILLFGFAAFYEDRLKTFDKNANAKFEELTKAKELAEKRAAVLEEPIIVINQLSEKRLEEKKLIKTSEEKIKDFYNKIEEEKKAILERNENVHDIETRIRCNRKKSYTEIDCNDKNILKDFS